MLLIMLLPPPTTPLQKSKFPDDMSVQDSPLAPFIGTVSRDFLLQIFFHEPSFPKPLKITLGSFRIFSIIRGDIRKSWCTAGGKFATGVNCTLLPKGVQKK
jgi:hypothetical protein